MSEESDSGSSSSSDEEYLPKVDDDFEKSFLKTLSSLKKNDPSIYDKDKKFFDESTSFAPVKNKKSLCKDSNAKPLFLKDYERKVLTENEGYEENKGEDKLNNFEENAPYAVEQRQLKESFKSFLDESDDEGILLKPSIKTEKEIQDAEADYVQWLKGQKQELEDKATEENLKNLRDFWNSDSLDKDEAFLRDYILNKKFLEEGESEEDNSDLSEDSEIYEEQENFEQEYNFRYETGENLIRRFPRNVEGSLRRKDNKRSKKRAEVKERKELEMKKKRQEINRQKKIKAKEIADRLEQLKQLTGNEKLAFNDEDILNDFDPSEHDRKMSEMYNDEFYNKEDEDKPCFDDLEDFKQEENFEESEVYENMEIEGLSSEPRKSKKEKKKSRTKRKRDKKKSFNDLLSIEKPIYDPNLHESYQKYMDEYYELDCEDFIEDLPCRFKYKQVEPNDYGLTVEEILSADDKELNRWSSIKKIYKMRSSHVEKNEAKIYREKGQNESLKMKILPSLYKTDTGDQNDSNLDHRKKTKKKPVENFVEDSAIDNECEMDGSGLNQVVAVDDSTEATTMSENRTKKRKRKSNSLSENSQHNEKSSEESQPNLKLGNNNSIKTQTLSSKPVKGFDKFKNQNKCKKNYNKTKANKKHNFHDSRLSAYGINPKKFKFKS